MIRSTLLLALALVLAASAPPAPAAGKKSHSVVVIENQSLWDIHQLYLSAVSEDDWGPDQLGAEIIASGESFRLTGIPCDSYDIKLVDEDGDQCVVGGVALCGDHDTWTITDDDLLTCQVLTED